MDKINPHELKDFLDAVKKDQATIAIEEADELKASSTKEIVAGKPSLLKQVLSSPAVFICVLLLTITVSVFLYVIHVETITTTHDLALSRQEVIIQKQIELLNLQSTKIAQNEKAVTELITLLEQQLEMQKYGLNERNKSKNEKGKGNQK